jgi:hypothetical protein
MPKSTKAAKAKKLRTGEKNKKLKLKRTENICTPSVPKYKMF